MWVDFVTTTGLTPDPFQVDAGSALESGHNVLVAAPTGSGKTLIGEFAVYRSLAEGNRAFYTTPIKALSNQKYDDFCTQFGADRVGLLTGDTSINPTGDVVVMTTEVLRNMLYHDDDRIGRLADVVMDEVHYLADRQRGAVWEEVILHLPPHVVITALSATVSNAEEFGAWIAEVRGNCHITVEERRIVPLHPLVLADCEFVDLFDPERAGSVNPQLLRWARDARLSATARDQRRHRGRGRGRRSHRSGPDPALPRRMSRAAIVRQLGRANLLPTIFFVFSRQGCEDALGQCLSADVTLTNETESAAIGQFVEQQCHQLRPHERHVLGYHAWKSELQRGLATHHAGMLPLFKETVEQLFRRGLTRAVFATETLALGINMPARSVVLDKLVKWDGTAHAQVTAGQYTQLTGRAGRRGIDPEGFAVTVWHPELDPRHLAGLASTRTYPLRSSFAPTYNMVVNLLGRMSVNDARSLLGQSFAQFQATAKIATVRQQLSENSEALAGYEKAMHCDRGNTTEYRRLLEIQTAAEKLPRGAEDRLDAIAAARAAVRDHPVHACPDRDQHLRWARRYWDLNRTNHKLDRQVTRATTSLAAAFDRIRAVLEDLRYIESSGNRQRATVTTAGAILARIYSEHDLLISEAIRRGMWEDLSAPVLAGTIAAVVFESRGRDDRRHGRERGRTAVPGESGRELVRALETLDDLADELIALEKRAGTSSVTPPDPGFSLTAMMWASGAGIEDVLADSDLQPGDFVRWNRQLLDVLAQVGVAAGSSRLSATARSAAAAINRSIVESSHV